MRYLARVSVFVLLLAAVAVIATPAFAARDDSDSTDNQIVITGTVNVPSGQVLDRVLILDGDVRVAGRVRDWVFALNGDVRVEGRVGGDVTAVNGRVTVTEAGSVGGDVVSGDPARIANRSSVAGDIERSRRRFALGWIGAVGLVVLWIALIVSSFVLGAILLLVAPRGAEAAAQAGRTSVGAAIGLGFAVALGLPIAAVVALVTIIGIPLGLGILLALALIYGVGYVAGAFFLGRVILREPRNRWLAFLVGWAILSVVGIVPVLNVLAFIAATVYGLGCLTVAIFRARRGPRGEAVPTEPPPEPEPVPAPVPVGAARSDAESAPAPGAQAPRTEPETAPSEPPPSEPSAEQPTDQPTERGTDPGDGPTRPPGTSGSPGDAG